MALTNFGFARGAPQSAGPAAAWPGRLAAAILPFVLILAWSAAVRLAFYGVAGDDEFFFSVIAREWLHGGLPYITAFDVKPPGIFFLYAVAQALFGASYATIKGLQVVAVAAGAAGLFVMLRPFGTGRRLAWWSAALYPVYTLALGGLFSVNMILQLPFIVAAFAAVVAATGEDAALRRRLAGAFLAGLAIGSAGMIKQTAIFEAAAAFLMLAVYGGREARLKMLALFVVGAALPALAFSAYYLAMGHFRALFDAVVVLALHRTGPDLAAVYGPDLAGYLTLPGALLNGILTALVVIFLWGGAVFTLIRRKLITASVPARVLVIAASWLAFSFAGAVYGRMLYAYYLLGIVPPLVILAGAFFCHGLRLPPSRQVAAIALSAVVGMATLAYTQYGDLFRRTPFATDRVLVAKAADVLRHLGMTPADRLLVFNREQALYTATQALPPEPYFHPTHLLSDFPTPVPDALGTALGSHPRFIAVADVHRARITTLPARLDRGLAYLAAHYRVAAVVHGAWDSFTIYEFVH